MTHVIEVSSAKLAMRNKFSFVLGIYIPPDKCKLQQFDAILSDVLAKIGANDRTNYCAIFAFRYFEF